MGERTKALWSLRLNGVYHACLAGLLLLFAGLLGWRPLPANSDFWGHAAVGRWTWQSGRAPDHTLFLWTASEDWVYHSWLFQLLSYGLTTMGGPGTTPVLAITVVTLIVLLCYAIVWLCWRRHGRLSAWLAVPFVLAVKAASPRFEARPELFSALFLCLLLAFLAAWSAAPGPRRWWTWVGLTAMLLMFVAWANLHGGVALGLLILAVTAGCDLVQDRFCPRSGLLVLLAVLAPLAVCLNPYGLAYWRAYASLATETFAHLDEWAPVWDRHTPFPLSTLAQCAVVAALALGAWGLNPRRRLAHLAWILVLAGLFASARRNVWPFTLACLMVLAVNAPAVDLPSLWRKVSRVGQRDLGAREEAPRLLVRWLVRVGLLAWVGVECLALGVYRTSWLPRGPTRLSEGIVRFIQDNQRAGRVFNDYENAGYLQWRLAGQPALYIDKLNAYPDEVLRNYLEILSVTQRGRRLLDEERIGIVVLTTNRSLTASSLAPLADSLDANSQWVRVYVARDGVVWVRRTPEQEHVWGPRLGMLPEAPFWKLEAYAYENQEMRASIRDGFGDPPVKKAAKKATRFVSGWGQLAGGQNPWLAAWTVQTMNPAARSEAAGATPRRQWP
jgi:hypothetical protein